jgi:hypothetical protein
VPTTNASSGVVPRDDGLDDRSGPDGNESGRGVAKTAVDGDGSSSKRRDAEALLEANRHFDKSRYSSCVRALEGVAPTSRTEKLRLRCLDKAGRQAEACQVARACEPDPFCTAYSNRRCP